MKNLNIDVSDEDYAILLKEKMRLSAKAGRQLTWEEVLSEIARKLSK